MSDKWAYLASGIALGCILTLLLLYSLQFLPKEAPAAGNGFLASEVGPIRLTKGRISGQALYARYRTSVTLPDHSVLVRLRQELSKKDARLSLETFRDRALFFLITNKLDSAIADLEEAVRRAPGEATLLSDLSALYDERAQAGNRAEDYLAALDKVERALSVSPALAEAVFNRAIVLEHLFLYEEAGRTWRRYLTIDNRSQWAAEAQEHLAKISRLIRRQAQPGRQVLLTQAVVEGDGDAVARLTAEGPQEAREILETSLLPKWAEAMARGEWEKADQRLKGARVIAEGLAQRDHDRVFQSIVTEMAAAVQAPPGDRRTSLLLQSLRQLREGYDGMNEGRPVEALQALISAEKGLRSIQSAAVLLARLHLAACYSQELRRCRSQR